MSRRASLARGCQNAQVRRAKDSLCRFLRLTTSRALPKAMALAAWTNPSISGAWPCAFSGQVLLTELPLSSWFGWWMELGRELSADWEVMPPTKKVRLSLLYSEKLTSTTRTTTAFQNVARMAGRGGTPPYARYATARTRPSVVLVQVSSRPQRCIYSNSQELR